MARPRKGNERPYDPAKYPDQARKLCLLGAIDTELAAFFEVSKATIKRWKKAHVEFKQALDEGKSMADANVTQRLYERATGYSHTTEKVTKTGVVEIVEKFPPDTIACIFWLKNRRPDLWRDRPVGENPQDAQEVARMVREAMRQMDDADGIGRAA
jgi:hypothetical protein